MKAILVLCLLACISCTSIFDVALCLLKHPKFKEEALNIYKAVQTKDFLTILNSAVNAFYTLKDVAMNECVEDEIVLKGICKHPIKYFKCLKECGLPDDSPRYCNCVHECNKVCEDEE